MTTKSELIAWLQHPDSIRVLLIEIEGVGNSPSPSINISSIPYTSRTTTYNSILQGGISFQESISTNGEVSVGFGDIEISNINGSVDQWLSYYWNNRIINIYVGDVHWERHPVSGSTQFYKIFSGLIDSIISRDRSTVNLVLVDKLQRLNEPIQTRTLKSDIPNPTVGTAAFTNQDRTIPIVLGEVFNIEGMQSQNVPNNLEYKINDGPINNIVEVRDNGVPISFTQNTNTGTFTLTQASYGQITCSVQGTTMASLAISNPQAHSILEITKYILTSMGSSSSRFDWNYEVDLDSFNNLLTTYYGTYSAGTYQYKDIRCGVYYTDSVNKLEVLNSILNSTRICMLVDSSGKLKFIPFNLPTNDDPTGKVLIIDKDFEFESLSISDITKPICRIRLGYNKNYTIQEQNLAGSIQDNHKLLYKDQYIVEDVFVDISSVNPYNLSDAVPEITETVLLDTDIANIEALYRLSMWQVPRKIVQIQAFSHLLPIGIGEIVHIKTARFGLSSGKNGIVISTEKNWLSGRITIGILI